MKLLKRLTINDHPTPLVRDHIALDISTPGRADFTVQSRAKLSGIVHFEIGAPNLIDFFTGYIEKSITVDSKQQRIFCRELTGVLWNTIPISARRVSMTDVLAIYARKTGLQFVSNGGEQPVPVFQTIGNGIHGLDSMGKVFAIDSYIWQQQADGVVYAGPWDKSKWADRDIDIPEQLFTDIQLDGSKTIAAVPGLRPGIKVNGEYINSLQLKDHNMVITCAKQLDV